MNCYAQPLARPYTKPLCLSPFLRSPPCPRDYSAEPTKILPRIKINNIEYKDALPTSNEVDNLTEVNQRNEQVRFEITEQMQRYKSSLISLFQRRQNPEVAGRSQLLDS